MYKAWFETERLTGLSITGTRQGCEFDGEKLILITIFLHGDREIGEYRDETHSEN